MFFGYGVIVLLTSFGFNGVLGGRTLYGGSLLILAAGMLVAVIAGLVGGYTAGLIGPGQRLVQCFPGPGAVWQLGYETNFLGTLEVRQMITSVIAKLGFRRGRGCFLRRQMR
jgi:hypothetical protein